MRVISLLLVASLLSSPALGACPSVDGPNPCFLYKYQRNTEYFVIANHNPVACDDELIKAAQDWTNAGSKFRLSQYPEYPTTYINNSVADPYFKVSFEGQYYMVNGINRTAESLYKQYNGYTVVNGESLWLTTDGDVRVNNDFYANKRILCENKAAIDPYQNQVDFGKIIAEEFGHSHGQGHITTTNCAMTNPTRAGTMYSNICATEADAVRRLFATDTYPIYR